MRVQSFSAAIGLRVLPGQENTENLFYWVLKKVKWSHECRNRLFHETKNKYTTHETIDRAYQVATLQGYSGPVST